MEGGRGGGCGRGVGWGGGGGGGGARIPNMTDDHKPTFSLDRQLLVNAQSTTEVDNRAMTMHYHTLKQVRLQKLQWLKLNCPEKSRTVRHV